jgi:hypothetical protein
MVSARGMPRPCDSPAMHRRPMAPSSRLAVRDLCRAHILVIGFAPEKVARTEDSSCCDRTCWRDHVGYEDGAGCHLLTFSVTRCRFLTHLAVYWNE